MNTSASEINDVIPARRHCTESGCRKCIARARWNRRKGWRSRKTLARRRTGRK
jgi:hypothetical protein